MMWPTISITESTSGGWCPYCGCSSGNCYGTVTVTTSFGRNYWREDERDEGPDPHEHLISANVGLEIEGPPPFSLPLVRYWPQARAPPKVC